MKTFQGRVKNPEIEPDDNPATQHMQPYIQPLRKLSKVDNVMFALKAAQLSRHLARPEEEAGIEMAINLIGKWLRQNENQKIYKYHPELIEAAVALNLPVDASIAARITADAAYTAGYADRSSGFAALAGIRADNRTVLLSYLQYLLKKEKEHNNFNHFDFHHKPELTQLKKLANIPATRITQDELTGIRTLLDEFDIDFDEFNWNEQDPHSVYNSLPEKYKLLQAIKREF